MTDPAADVMDQLAGLTPDSPLAVLRRERPDVVRHTQASDEALFAPGDDGGLTRAERAAIALRMATLLGDTVLRDHYRRRLGALDPGGVLAQSMASDPGEAADPRWAAILAHVDQVTSAPSGATRAHIARLRAVGLSPHAVISLSQLIAYVSYQSRVLAGLRLLGGGR